MNHTVPCPGCGRMVDIPEGMDACFCTFCGARVTRTSPEATTAPAKVSCVEAAGIPGEMVIWPSSSAKPPMPTNFSPTVLSWSP